VFPSLHLAINNIPNKNIRAAAKHTRLAIIRKTHRELAITDNSKEHKATPISIYSLLSTFVLSHAAMESAESLDGRRT
jgi:hypothetical protein